MPVKSIEELSALLPQLAAEARLRGAGFETPRRIAPDFADELERAGQVGQAESSWRRVSLAPVRLR
jgi:hypothetical protein